MSFPMTEDYPESSQDMIVEVESQPVILEVTPSLDEFLGLSVLNEESPASHPGRFLKLEICGGTSTWDLRNTGGTTDLEFQQLFNRSPDEPARGTIPHPWLDTNIRGAKHRSRSVQSVSFEWKDFVGEVWVTKTGYGAGFDVVLTDQTTRVTVRTPYRRGLTKEQYKQFKTVRCLSFYDPSGNYLVTSSSKDLKFFDRSGEQNSAVARLHVVQPVDLYHDQATSRCFYRGEHRWLQPLPMPLQ